MAKKNILNKVKTASGYDTLYPLTPYQIFTATAVSGTGSVYNVTIPLPAEDMIVPIYIRFKANANAQSGCKISVNGSTSVNIFGSVSGVVKTNDICVVVYDSGVSTNPATPKCYLVNIENKTAEQSSFVGGTTVFNTNSVNTTYNNGATLTTTFNDNGSITETLVQNGVTTSKTTTFNSDGTITEVVS